MKDQGRIVQISVSDGGVPKTAVPAADLQGEGHAIVPGGVKTGDPVRVLPPGPGE